jgi:hypothetical protein
MRLTQLRGQLYANLIALTLADDCKIHNLAGLGLADRAHEVVEITRSLTVDCYNQIMRFAQATALDRYRAHHGGRKEKRSRGQHDGQGRPDCHSPTSYAGCRARTARAHSMNLDPAKPLAAFEFAPPAVYLHSHQGGFIGLAEGGSASHIIGRTQMACFAIRDTLPGNGNPYVSGEDNPKYDPRHRRSDDRPSHLVLTDVNMVASLAGATSNLSLGMHGSAHIGGHFEKPPHFIFE